MNGLRLTVAETSKILGISEQFIRYLLQQKKLPIGCAVKNSKGTGYRYLIYSNLVEKFIGDDGFTKLAELESGND